MGIVIVEICESNPAAGLDVEALESEFEGVSVIVSYCLSECTLCAEKPFMMVNGELVVADELDSLMDQVRAKISEELAMWS
jgi:uncharacterized protein YuzB (UPF0349 family)